MTSATPIKKKSTFKAPLAKEEKVESSFRTTCKYLCSYLYRLLTSTFGMVIMLVVYAFIGAAIFKLIEGTHENQQSKMVNKVAVDIIDNVWNCSLEVKKSEKAFKLLMKQELIKYEHQLRESIAQGVTWDTEIKVWDFWGSFFYATTIVTTIGEWSVRPLDKSHKSHNALHPTIHHSDQNCANISVLNDVLWGIRGKCIMGFVRFLYSNT